MLNYILKYPLQISPPSANFPYGGAQNITVPDDGTGTPWDYELINDILGFFQKMVTEASITPSGSSETVLASDVYDALDSFLNLIDDKYLPDNVEKLLLNDASVAPGDAFIGRGYQGNQFYGREAVGIQYYAFGATVEQYYSRAATGPIELGSTLGAHADKKLISGAKEATFEEIIDATGDASTTVKGIVELATNTEAIAGTDTDRAVVPAALAAVLAALTGWGAWITPAYVSPWEANTSLGNQALQYRRSADSKQLQIRGTLNNPSSSALSHAVVLPAGYIPPGNTPIYCPRASDGVSASCILQGTGGSNDGQLQMNGHVAGTTYFINQIIALD